MGGSSTISTVEPKIGGFAVQKSLLGVAIARCWGTTRFGGNLLDYRVSDATVMKYLRNNSMFAYGRADRARTSATYREILDAMWLFNDKFERALAEYQKIKAAH